MFCHPYIDEDRPDVSSVGPVGAFRVSDADRNEVIERLQRHTSEGRLTLDEFEARLAEVHEAKSGDELRNSLRELPAGTAPRRFGGSGRGYRHRQWFRLPLVVVALAIAIVVLTPAPFPLIPIAFWSVVALTALRHRRQWSRHQGRWGPARVPHL